MAFQRSKLQKPIFGKKAFEAFSSWHVENNFCRRHSFTRHVSKIRFPTAVFQHEWMEWTESGGIFYFWDTAHTVKSARQTVQSVSINKYGERNTCFLMAGMIEHTARIISIIKK